MGSPYRSIDQVRLEVNIPKANRFIIGQSLLGSATDLLGEATDTSIWTDITPDAQGITVTRGGTNNGAGTSVDVGTLTAQGLDTWDDSGTLKPGAAVRLVAKNNGTDVSPIFTGVVSDMTHTDRRDDHTVSTLFAADGVSSLANTQRYGAVSDNGVGYETWAARIRRLCASANTPTSQPGAETQVRQVYGYNAYRTSPATVTSRRDGWTVWGTAPAGVDTSATTISGPFSGVYGSNALKWGVNATTTGTKTVADLAWGIQRTVTGLTVGTRYRFSAKVSQGIASREYCLGVSGIGWSDPTRNDMMPYEFTATATSHVLRVGVKAFSASVGVGSAVTLVYLDRLRLDEYVGDVILLCDTVYEGPLSNHLDMASNSMAAAWWVDRNNVAQFRLRLDDNDPVVAQFYDDPASVAAPEVAGLRTSTIKSPWLDNADLVMESLSGAFTATSLPSPDPVPWTTGKRFKITTGSTAWVGLITPAYTVPSGPAGDSWTLSAWVRSSAADTSGGVPVSLVPAVENASTGAYTYYYSDDVAWGSAWRRLFVTFTTASAYSDISPDIYLGSGDAASVAAGVTVDVAGVLLEKTSALGDYFDGVGPILPNATNAWTGASGASNSTQTLYTLGTAVPYTDLRASYDTKNVVNDLAMNNHGMDGSGYALDATFSVRDANSIATWGQKSASLDTTIENDGGLAGSVAKVGAWILAGTSTPTPSVKSLRFVGSEYPVVGAGLDIYSRISIARKGTTDLYRVVAINHTIEDDRWLVDLDLIKE